MPALEPPATPPVPITRARGFARLAGLICGLQSLVLLGFAAFYGYELTLGEGSDPVWTAMTLVLILVFAALLAVLARGWLIGRAWPRTPTLVWNALLLPIAWTLHDSRREAIAIAVGAVALAGVLAAVRSPGPDQVRERRAGG